MELYETDSNQAPVGANIKTVTTDDGLQLRACIWYPSIPANKGTVCILQGRSEYIEKYYEVIGELCARGLTVAAFDWRGQGASERVLKSKRKLHYGHINYFGDYLNDLNAVMENLVLPDCPRPFYALAHSMAGCICLHAISRNPMLFDRAVLVAPMIGIHTNFPFGLLQKGAEFIVYAGFGGSLVPTSSKIVSNPTDFAGNKFTSDAPRFMRHVEMISEHPHLMITKPTFSWIANALQAMRELQSPNVYTNIKIPLLAIGASNDSVVDTLATDRLCQRLRSGHHMPIYGARHEILHEVNSIRSQFYAAFDEFIPGTPL